MNCDRLREVVASSRALSRLAALRFAVFRAFPCLYDFWCVHVSPFFHPVTTVGAPPLCHETKAVARSCGGDVARVLVFSTNDYGWGGSEVALLRLADLLARDRRLEVSLCMSDMRPRAALLEKTLAEGRFSFYGRDVRIYHWRSRYRRLLERLRPDFVLMGHGSLHEGRKLMQWCISLGIPFANILPLFGEHEISRLGEKFYRRRIAPLLARSQCIFSDNALTADALRRIAGGAMPWFVLLPNPPDVNREQPLDWPDEGGGLRLMMMARLTPWHKGLDLLVDVLSKEKWRHRDLTVDIYGEGEYRPALERARDRSGAKISLKGIVEDYAGEIHAHHGGMFTSRMEGLPLTLVSYMLCNRMVVSTAVGGIPEYVVDGVSGYLAEEPTAESIDRALERAWNDRAHWRERGEEAGRIVRGKIPERIEFPVVDLILRTARRGAGSRRVKFAYLVDRPDVGGGYEYVLRRTLRDEAEGRAWRIFSSSAGECTASAIDAWGADEIVVNHLKALVQLLLLHSGRPKGRITFVVHGLHLRKYECRMREGGLSGILAIVPYAMRRTLEWWLYRKCDRIVVEIEGDREAVHRLYGSRLHVDVEANSLDGWTHHPAESLPDGLGGPFQYLCIGRFNYQKGQDRWIRAIRGKTLFVGDGEMLAECKALARRQGVAQQCVFAGTIPDADRYLTCVPIVVSPSRWEGMPYLMMKARALGCRILATDCPGNRDVLAGYDKWEKLVF